MFHRFLIWPFIAGLLFSSFSPKDIRAELCPLEVHKRKRFVMATPTKPFDGIP